MIKAALIAITTTLGLGAAASASDGSHLSRVTNSNSIVVGTTRSVGNAATVNKFRDTYTHGSAYGGSRNRTTTVDNWTENGASLDFVQASSASITHDLNGLRSTTGVNSRFSVGGESLTFSRSVTDKTNKFSWSTNGDARETTRSSGVVVTNQNRNTLTTRSSVEFGDFWSID